WLAHLPLLREAHERDMGTGQWYGVSRESMLRELVEALSLGTAAHGLVLVLEDLQWSDASTVELLAYVARRTDRLRLLVLGTYRPAEVIAGGIRCGRRYRNWWRTGCARSCGWNC